MAGPEATIERKAIEFAKAQGWFECKIKLAAPKGMPDRYLARAGRSVWCEFKAPGEEPNAQQALRHKDLREAGMEVVWFDNLEDARAFFA